ncbi:MAG: SCO family protein [Planctomycetota bacterium]|nr:SCO family protein [Planctomycetota bacterium]
MWEKKNLFAIITAIFIVAAATSPRVSAEVNGPSDSLPNTLPREYRDVGVTEHRGDQIPPDIQFNDEHGNPVTLSKFFQSKRPLVLQLGYFDCPMLCDVVSRGLIESAKNMKLKAGSDFDFLFVSINPSESPDSAALKKEHYLQEYAKEGESTGFHFLTGDEGDIRRLAAAVGFRYNWVPSVRQYAHPAVIMILMPDGKLSKYLYGVKFPEQTLRLSLVEASDGKIGDPMDQILLFCLHYDAITGKYAIAAMRLMQLGCAVTALTVGGTLFWFFRREGAVRLQTKPLDDGNDDPTNSMK